MKFHKSCKIHKAAAKDAGRYAMHHVRLERDYAGARLIATDGRILAVLPVQDAEQDDDGFLSSESIAEAVKKPSKKNDTATILANGSIRACAVEAGPVVEFERPSNDHEFPKWRAVVPEGEPTVRICLNPSYLATVAHAIGAGDGVVLEFYAPAAEGGRPGPIAVRPAFPIGGAVKGNEKATDGAERFGVIMPIELK